MKEEVNSKDLSKQEKASELTKKYMWWTMGAGLIPIPFVDLLAVSGVQLKMLKDMSDIYDISFSENRVKSIVTALLGSVLPVSVATGGIGSALKMIPIIGGLIGGVSMSLFSGAATYAIGKVFIQHFETGGTFLDFDVESMKAFFNEEFEKGKKAANDMKAKKSANSETSTK